MNKTSTINSFLRKKSTVDALKELRDIHKNMKRVDGFVDDKEFLMKFRKIHRDALKDHFSSDLTKGKELPGHMISIEDFPRPLGIKDDSHLLVHSRVHNDEVKNPIKGAGVASVRIADLLGRRSGIPASTMEAQSPVWGLRKSGYKFHGSKIPKDIKNQDEFVKDKYKDAIKEFKEKGHSVKGPGTGYKSLDPTGTNYDKIKKAIDDFQSHS